MTVVFHLIVVLHLLGMAAIVGGWLTTFAAPRTNQVMLWGARAQLITGLVLVGLVESGVIDEEEELNHAKIGVKLLVALAVAAFAEISAARAKRGGTVATWMPQAVGALAILNVLVAVLWE
jgi:hypothetical protein